MRANARSGLGLAGWLVLCFSAGAFGSLFAPGPWYEALAKPSFNPPGWIFGPVWTLLYALMAVAAWLVWRDHGWRGARRPLLFFLAQLAANAAWSWLFFGLRRPDLALADILLLWVALCVTLVHFWRARRGAGALLLPYLLWVSFAVVLNFEILRLNP